jgi:hypothetical protein
VRHELKTWPQYFAAVAAYKKDFEVRKDDRGFDLGHELVLREWCPIMKDYTGREEIRFVKFVLRDVAGIESGYVVLGLQDEPF